VVKILRLVPGSDSRLGFSWLPMVLKPVTLLPGRPKLATRPASTGSGPTPVKTIGIVEVALFAACAEATPPVVAITSTFWPTRSAASAANRS